MTNRNEKGFISYKAGYATADGQIEDIQDGCDTARPAKAFCQEHHEHRISTAEHVDEDAAS